MKWLRYQRVISLGVCRIIELSFHGDPGNRCDTIKLSLVIQVRIKPQVWHDKPLFVCFESHEQFFSYLATVTITGDGATNIDLCLALTAFSSEGSFTCHRCGTMKLSLVIQVRIKPRVWHDKPRVWHDEAISS
jgi:hypothetical protein